MPDSKGKTITIEILKFALYVGAMIVSITVFIMSSQAQQDSKINTNCTSIEKNSTKHEAHVEHATEAFRKLDDTMMEQRKVMTDTREVLIRLDESNKQLAEQVKGLAERAIP